MTALIFAWLIVIVAYGLGLLLLALYYRTRNELSGLIGLFSIAVALVLTGIVLRGIS